MTIAKRRVLGYGPKNAKVMIVGEAPGKTEVDQGMPFAGRGGQILHKVLLATGVNPRDVRFTYLVQHQPPGNDLSLWFARKGDKVVPNNILVIEGLTSLRAEIEEVNPNLIVALGNYALWALAGVARVPKNNGLPIGIGDWRGSVIEGSKFAGGRKVLASYAPGFIDRNYAVLPLFEGDISKIKKEMEFPEIRRRPRLVHLDPQGIERERLIEKILDSNKPIAIDIEYTRNTGRLICAGFGVDPEEAVTIATKSGGDINDFKRVVESGRPLVMQNGSFDCGILEYHYGFKCIQHLEYDTMLAMHAAFIELPKDLGTLCSIYTDQPCYWTQLGEGHWKQPQTESWLQATMKYNAIDVYVTSEVREAQIGDELLDANIAKTFQFEMDLIAPLWRMSRQGVRIDHKGLNSYAKELVIRGDELTEELKTHVGRDINVKSGTQVANLLFGDSTKGGYGLPSTRKTLKGKPATDDKTLVDISRKSEGDARRAVDIIREIRDCRDLRSKFLELKLDDDGRFRCHYKVGGTVTGRLSSSKFFPTQSGGNLQNIPKDPRVRRLFIPDPGKTFFYNDLKSAESFVVAHITGDPLMLQIHQPGQKPHEITASMLFDIPVEDIGKDSIERALGKMTRHACNYSMGWKRFMDNVNAKSLETGVYIDAKMAKHLVSKYRQIHPYLESWWRSIEQQLYATRTLHTLLGRPRKFFNRISAVLPEAIAYVPQSTVGDLVNIALLRIYKDEELRDYGLEMLLQVHDAIGGQVDDKWVLPAMRRYQELSAIPLQNPNGEEFVIPLDISVGTSWADVKELDLAETTAA